MQHVAQVRELTESAAILQEEVDSLRIFKARTEQENRAKEWQASSATATLPSQIASGLKAQMAHSQNLKHSKKRISWSCGGSNLEVLKKAFPAVTGSSINVTPSSLGFQPKFLRYGAALDIVGDVKVQLSGVSHDTCCTYQPPLPLNSSCCAAGSTITATATYSMIR